MSAKVVGVPFQGPATSPASDHAVLPPMPMARVTSPVTAVHLDADVAAAGGPEWVETLSGPPTSAFLAEGSEGTVSDGRRVEG